jgi:hypothetical protein
VPHASGAGGLFERVREGWGCFRFTDQNVSDEIEGKGRMAGDLSDMDWLVFAMKTLNYPLRMSCFEMASHRSIRTVAVEREYRTRVCRECGMPLNIYGGMCDHEGEPARFLFDNNIRAFRKDYGAVKEGMKILLEARDGDGVKLSEVSPKVQLMVSREECMNPGVYADSHDEENVS